MIFVVVASYIVAILAILQQPQTLDRNPKYAVVYHMLQTRGDLGIYRFNEHETEERKSNSTLRK